MQIENHSTDSFSNTTLEFIEIQNIARLLLAEIPRVGEYAARPIKALDLIFSHGSGVVRYEIPGLPDSYVVLNPDGTRYTTTEVPTHLNPEDFLVERPATYQGKHVWNKLISISNSIKINAPDFDNTFNIKDIIDTINCLMLSQPLDNNYIKNIINNNILLRAELRENSGNTVKYLNSQIQLTTEAFLKFQVNGDFAKNKIAFLSFSCEHSHPEKILEADLKLNHPQNSITTVSSQYTDNLHLNPLRYYLLHSDFSNQESFNAAVRAAKKFRKAGKDLVRQALSSSRVVSFHDNLYAAFLKYRVAQTIYDELKSIHREKGQIPCDLTHNDLHRLWVETEEARVAIISSILFSAMPSHRGPNISKIQDYFNYWQEILESLGAEKTQIGIQDMVIRWVCPIFLRDLTLSWLALENEEYSPHLIQRLSKILELLEKDSVNNTLIEPDYRQTCRSILSGLKNLGQV